MQILGADSKLKSIDLNMSHRNSEDIQLESSLKYQELCLPLKGLATKQTRGSRRLQIFEAITDEIKENKQS